MNCPACQEPMIILEYEHVEVDFCVSCRGIWLDAGELELLFGDRSLAGGFMAAGGDSPATGEKLRNCPICRKKMTKQVTGGPQPVTYDQCARGDGMWFDQGELTAVLKHGSSSPGGDAVAAWLREMFPDDDGAPNE